MTRISKLPTAEWDPELRSMVAADEATSVEQGADSDVIAPPIPT